ncbi:uncharacterized protein [Acropora muricata]|uniref:uncharacterized protein isoform X2 n=1 Tax=Acropora muricata TaxID=159855 RepID=UPI0034E462E0
MLSITLFQSGFPRFSQRMSKVPIKGSSWSFSSKGFGNDTNDPFTAVYALKKQNREGNSLQGGMACSVMIEVGKAPVMHFVTSVDSLVSLKSICSRNSTEMHPFPKTKLKRNRLETNSAVIDFGRFSFFRMNTEIPGFDIHQEVTRLDFQVPRGNRESHFEAYTFVGSKRVNLKFVYESASRKHVLKEQGGQLDRAYVLGAPIIIENQDVRDKYLSSRWPVVGVVGLNEELEVCPYFVTADMFDDSTSQIERESCEGSSKSSGVAHARDLGAQECYELSLKKARQAGDRATERKAILKLGIVYSSRGDHRQAIECYKKSLDIGKETGDLVGVKHAQERLWKSYLDLGDTHLFCSRSDHQPAIECYTKSLDIAKEAGHLAGVKLAQERLQKSYLDLGDTHYFCSRGDHRQAIKFYKKSLDIAKEAGDLVGEKLAQERLWKSYLDLGDTHLFCSRGDHEQAIKCYTNSIDIAKEAGDLVGEKLAQERLWKSHLDLGDTHLFCSHADHGQAIKFYKKSLDIAKEAGDLVGEKLAQERLWKSYLDLGDTHLFCSHADHGQAIEVYTKGLKIAKEAGDLTGEKIVEERLLKSHLVLSLNWSCYRLCQKAIPKQGERLAPGNESNATAAGDYC